MTIAIPAFAAPHFPGLADVPVWLAKIVAKYETIKVGTATASGVNDWLLHMNGGMLILVLVAIVFRRTLASPWPLLVVIVAEGINEYFDRLAYGGWRWEDSSRDIFFTLLWPALLFLLLGSGLVKRD